MTFDKTISDHWSFWSCLYLTEHSINIKDATCKLGLVTWERNSVRRHFFKEGLQMKYHTQWGFVSSLHLIQRENSQKSKTLLQAFVGPGGNNTLLITKKQLEGAKTLFFTTTFTMKDGQLTFKGGSEQHAKNFIKPMKPWVISYAMCRSCYCLIQRALPTPADALSHRQLAVMHITLCDL